MLNLSAKELARLSRVGEGTIGNFETGRCKPIPSTIAAIRAALEAAGAVFQHGDYPGVMLKRAQ